VKLHGMLFSNIKRYSGFIESGYLNGLRVIGD